MPVLRRSCQACAKARRRCNLVTPRCERCSAKRITCRYVNEPAPATLNIREKNQNKLTKKFWNLHGVQNAETLSYLVTFGLLDTDLQRYIRQVLREDSYDGSRSPLWSSTLSYLPANTIRRSIDTGIRIFNPLHLEIVRVFEPTTLQRLSEILQSFPAEFSEHGTTSFIHSGLYGSWLPQPLQDIRQICSSYNTGGEYLVHSKLDALRSTIRRLLHSATRASSFTDMLAYAQATSLAQIIRLLECHDPDEDEVERDNEKMWAITHRLWQHAPIQLPSTLSPWQAWLFSENVRRTIMVCNILLGVYSSLKRGYTIHPLCIEALPFDVRTRLWDADNETSWVNTASMFPNPSLVTLSQFTALQQPTRGGSRFEDLLLLSFGK
ncbi:hypothetical protein FSARC_7231 [Fusarium sarcochroum]|uniref:Zn(2)-C6 fungal-type domain-containing protein n=1 Tax=Fusarium sarcochroum TaxID=1208366 RepID=A0A8H4TVM2_9HYPO|nr:hypothetical protein FSARC_7231 [Fusarium sarcochroum]